MHDRQPIAAPAQEALPDQSRSQRPKLPPLPPIKVAIDGGTARISLGTGDDFEVARERLNLVFGTLNNDFTGGVMAQLLNVVAATPEARAGGSDALNADYRFALSSISGIAPQDEVEALLATQMVAIHLSTMAAARRLAAARAPVAIEAADRQLNKLARTFAAQAEALKRYRSTGDQKILVQHQQVTVEDGGQAIVGNSIATTPRGAT